jgi:regulation of enolase protein 1 (concanavalin A-like superfamily)
MSIVLLSVRAVRLASLQNVDGFTKAGVMMRDGLTAGARNVTMITTPTAANGHRFQVRATAGGTTTKTQSAGAGTAPIWFRLVRSGNTFTGSHSSNGTTWTQVGTSTIAMASTIQVGMVVTSHLDGSLASAVFDSVSP